MAKITKTFQYGNHQVTLETGEVARQASGATVNDVDGAGVLKTREVFTGDADGEIGGADRSAEVAGHERRTESIAELGDIQDVVGALAEELRQP